MQTQFRIILWFLLFNIVAFVVLNATTNGEYLFPGVDQMHPINATGNVTEYEDQFNGTQLVEGWQPAGNYGFAGDLFSGLNMFWNMFRFIIDGVGMTIEWVATFIPAASTALTWVAYIIRGIMAAIAASMVIEFITGRQLLD